MAAINIPIETDDMTLDSVNQPGIINPKDIENPEEMLEPLLSEKNKLKFHNLGTENDVI